MPWKTKMAAVDFSDSSDSILVVYTREVGEDGVVYAGSHGATLLALRDCFVGGKPREVGISYMKSTTSEVLEDILTSAPILIVLGEDYQYLSSVVDVLPAARYSPTHTRYHLGGEWRSALHLPLTLPVDLRRVEAIAHWARLEVVACR